MSGLRRNTQRELAREPNERGEAQAPISGVPGAEPVVAVAEPESPAVTIAHLVGAPQQDDIVRTADRLLCLGQDILAMSEGPAAAPP
jgi:hypothetical protein